MIMKKSDIICLHKFKWGQKNNTSRVKCPQNTPYKGHRTAAQLLVPYLIYAVQADM